MNGADRGSKHIFQLINGKQEGRELCMSHETWEEKEARVKGVLQNLLGGVDTGERAAIMDTRRALSAVADLCARGAEEDGLRTLEDVAARDMSALLRVISRSLGEPA